jgi:hypothetical protein
MPELVDPDFLQERFLTSLDHLGLRLVELRSNTLQVDG